MIGSWMLALILGCPKDRTGTSSTQDLMNSVTEVESLILKMNEVEQRIAKMENVTRARGQDEILKLESLDQVRVEMANMRGELERMGFQLEQLDGTSKNQQADAQFRLDWLEKRASQLEGSLGMDTPPPTDDAASTSSNLDSQQGMANQTDVQTGSQTNPQQNASQNISKTDSNVSSKKSNKSNNASNDAQPTDGGSSAEELLKLAKEHLVGGREEAAEAVLNRVLKEYPRSKLEAEVRYRLAEAAFNSQQYPESARRFQDVINRHPSSPFASWSLLRQGECFDALGQPENAAIFYNDVIAEYPKSKAAKEAKTKLK